MSYNAVSARKQGFWSNGRPPRGTVEVRRVSLIDVNSCVIFQSLLDSILSVITLNPTKHFPAALSLI